VQAAAWGRQQLLQEAGVGPALAHMKAARAGNCRCRQSVSERCARLPRSFALRYPAEKLIALSARTVTCKALHILDAGCKGQLDESAAA
jgi:hypothetical protein